MAGFHVYVDGPVERTPEAMRRLAAAMAQRYGLATEELVARLTRGRFRVKANVDRKTADVYAKDLAEIGARVTVEDASRASVTTPPVGVGVQRSAPITARQVPALPPTAGAAVDEGSGGMAAGSAGVRAATATAPMTGAAGAAPGAAMAAAASGGVSRSARAASQAMPIIERRRTTPTASRPGVAASAGERAAQATVGPRHSESSSSASASLAADLSGPRPTSSPLPPATASGRPAGTSLPPATSGGRPAGTSLPLATAGGRPSGSSLPPAMAGGRPSGASLPPATGGRPSGTSLPPATSGGRPPGTSLPPATSGGRPSGSSLPPATSGGRPSGSSLPEMTSGGRPSGSSLPPATSAAREAGSVLPAATEVWPASDRATDGGQAAAASQRVAGRDAQGGLAGAGMGGSVSPMETVGASGMPASGMAAAFAELPVSADLGALDMSGGPLSLSSVGGDAVAPARDGMAAAAGGGAFAPPLGQSAARARPKDVPVDLFAPPDIAEQQAMFELAVDEDELKARQQQALTHEQAGAQSGAAAQPRAGAQPGAVAHQLAGRQQQAGPQALVAASSLIAPMSSGRQPGATAAPMPYDGGGDGREQGATTLLGAVREAPRGRLVMGVVLAIVVGFVPVHLIARSREVAAFAAVDRGVEARQAAVDSPEAYAALDGFRGAQLEKKLDAKRSIAITSLLLWALIAAGLGYVWFRRVPWARFARG